VPHLHLSHVRLEFIIRPCAPHHFGVYVIHANRDRTFLDLAQIAAADFRLICKIVLG
jgi:hypothetical protein